MYVTVKGGLAMVNLRTMETVWKAKVSAAHGVPTALMVDPEMGCVVGTSRGSLGVWDVRTGIHRWTGHLKQPRRIRKVVKADHRFSLKSTEKDDLVLVSVDNAVGEVSLWDLKRRKCRAAWVRVYNEGMTLEEAFIAQSGYQEGSFEVGFNS